MLLVVLLKFLEEPLLSNWKPLGMPQAILRAQAKRLAH
ncbi:hypothetical protein QG37_08374 [Candidozyma auris]|nr:hypothetical protein QG37_08374 [[Candida] auris]